MANFADEKQTSRLHGTKKLTAMIIFEDPCPKGGGSVLAKILEIFTKNKFPKL